jgi:hypothetical protein
MDVSKSGFTPITSAEFREKNRIFFECPLTKSVDAQDANWADHVDLNSNGQVDFKDSMLLNLGCRTYTEPFMLPHTDQMKKFSEVNNTEVLTKNEIGEQKCWNLSYKWNTMTGMSKYDSEGEIPLTDLARKEAPFSPNAQWAIDTTNMHLLVFEPIGT